jgi:hypothetical protein
MSSVLAGGPPLRADSQQLSGMARPSSAPGAPARPPGHTPVAGGAAQRGNALTVIAGVGVLLLAMGVGVLIGRSGSSKAAPAPVPTISVTAPPAAAATPAPAAEATFTGSWPAGTSGYTVQLQKLPQKGTAVSAVEAAKSSAGAKGATALGALKSEEFSSLAPGSYVIYSGVYHTMAQAQKALGGLRKSFPGASVIHVSSASQTASPPTSSPGGVGQSENHPAPPTVLKSLHKSKGKSYEESSKNLPNVVETG